MPTIEETCVAISHLEHRWEVEKTQRYARRNKIRYIDRLLNELEQLNIADEAEIPTELRTLCREFVDGEGHALARRSVAEVAIAEWMDALYDIQDSLMFAMEDEED